MIEQKEEIDQAFCHLMNMGSDLKLTQILVVHVFLIDIQVFH